MAGWRGLVLAVMLLSSVTTPAPAGLSLRPAGATGPNAFFVAPEGNNAWSGRLPEPNGTRSDGPFATITRARAAIRQLKAAPGGLEQPVTVFIRGGALVRSEPMVFTPEDSGASQCPITYAAYQGERVVISGGRRISGWKRVTVGGKSLWAAPIPEVREGHWYFRQLWVNGVVVSGASPDGAGRAGRWRVLSSGHWRTRRHSRGWSPRLHLYYTGLSAGWTWGYGKPLARGNVVEQ